jgi:hypothetical protein
MDSIGRADQRCMGLTRFEILEIWERTYGRLSEDWRQAFLADRRVIHLTGADSSAVRSAIASNQKLDDVLQSIAPPCPPPADAESRRPNANTRSHFLYGHFPHQPNDPDLHKRIGPTQRYEEDT